MYGKGEKSERGIGRKEWKETIGKDSKYEGNDERIVNERRKCGSVWKVVMERGRKGNAAEGVDEKRMTMMRRNVKG